MNNHCMNNRSQNMRYASSTKYRNANNTRTEEKSSSMMRNMQIHWGDLPLAMAYVPRQKYGELFDLSKALQVGTIFPELCKPFCGKGGGC